MNRRNFLKLGVVAAPAVILTPGLLMPVKSLWKPLLTADLIVKELINKQTNLLAIQPTKLIIPYTYRWVSYAGIDKYTGAGWEVVILGPRETNTLMRISTDA